MFNLRQFFSTFVVAFLTVLSSTSVSTADHPVGWFNATQSPPFAVMQGHPVNPVASMPNETAEPLIREARQIGALEISQGDHQSSFPSTEIIATWTVTHSPKKRQLDDFSDANLEPTVSSRTGDENSENARAVVLKRNVAEERSSEIIAPGSDKSTAENKKAEEFARRMEEFRRRQAHGPRRTTTKEKPLYNMGHLPFGQEAQPGKQPGKGPSSNPIVFQPFVLGA